MNLITSESLSLTGSDVAFDLGSALGVATSGGNAYVPKAYWPRQILVVSTTGIAMAAALEYVNVGLASPTSTYDGIATGSSLTSATMTGAFLFDPTANYPITIYVQPYPIQIKTNLKVHCYGASGAALISAQRTG